MKLKSLFCWSVLFALAFSIVLVPEAVAQEKKATGLVIGDPIDIGDPPPPPPPPQKKCYKFDFDVGPPEGHSCQGPNDGECSQPARDPDPNAEPDGLPRCPGIVTQEIEYLENECVDCKKGVKGCKACTLKDRKYKKLVAVGALVCPDGPTDGECGCSFVFVPDIPDDWFEDNGLDPDLEFPVWEFIEIEAPRGVKCKDAMIDIPDVEEQEVEEDI